MKYVTERYVFSALPSLLACVTPEAMACAAARFHERMDLNKEDLKAADAWIAGVLAGLAKLQLKSFQQFGGESFS